MPSPCPRCGKPVYLVDELRCLEKVWHKDCFRCRTCNRLLTILTYKGFDKQPYCEQHLPEAKHTSVADSFATRHAKEAARLQSLIEYRKEYEATKGDKISVADDVLTRRLLANARNVGPAQRCWNRERKRAMDDDPDQVTAEDDVMAPEPEECIVLGPIDEHQDQSQPLTHSEATPSSSADPAELSPHDELPGNSITLKDTIIEQQLNNSLLGALSCIVEQDDCRRCQGPLNPRTQIDYKNKAWHRKCFKCQLCGSPICFALQMEQQVVPVCIIRNKKGIAHSERRNTPEELAEEEEIAREVSRALAWPRTKRVALTTEAPAAVAYDDNAATTVTDDNAAAAIAADTAVAAIADDVAALSVTVADVEDAATATGSCDLALLAEPTPEVVRRRQPDVAQLAARASADERGAGDRASKRPSSGAATRFRAIRRAINVAYSAAAQKFRQVLQSKRAKKKAKQAGKSKAPKAASTSFADSASSAPSSLLSSSSDSSSAAALESAQLDANEHRETAPPAAGSEHGAAPVHVPIDDGLEFDIVLVPGASDHMTRTLPFTRLHVSFPRTSTPKELSPGTAARILELYIPVCFHPIGETPERWKACVDTGVSSPEPPQAMAHSTPVKPFTGSCWGRFAPAAAPAEFAAALSVPKASALPSGDEALPEQRCLRQAVQSAAARGSENTSVKRERNKARRALFFPPTGIGEGVQSTRQEHEAHDAAPNLAASAGVRAAQKCCSTSCDEEGSAAEQQKANARDSAASRGNSSDGDDLHVAVIQSPITELYGGFMKELAARGLALPTIPERSGKSKSTADAPSAGLVPALPSLVITENNVAGRYPRYQRGDLLIDVKPVTTGGFVVGTVARTGDRGFVRVEHVRDPQRQLLP